MGPALCLLSAACFGAMAIFGKLAYNAGVTPGALLLVRFTLAALLLGIVLLLRPGLRRLEPSRLEPSRLEPSRLEPSRDGHRCPEPGRGESGGTGPGRRKAAASHGRALATALGLGAIGYAAQASLFFAALQRMDASLLSLILYSYPILVTVAAVLLGRDRLTPGRAVALVTASGGTLLVLLGAGGGSFDPFGALLGFGSAVVYTAYILVSDTVVHRLPPVVLAALVMAGAAGTLGVRAALTGGVSLHFGPAGWFWLACLALVSTVVAMLAFFAGLKRTGPSTAAILSNLEPVVTTVLAAIALGEFLRPTQLVGGALVVACVVILQARPAPRQLPGDSSACAGAVASGHEVLVDGGQHRFLEAPAPDFRPVPKRLGPSVVDVERKDGPAIGTNVRISHPNSLDMTRS